MKKLTKIKLINWHLFPNQTIEISGNTLISGENGSGKSTLLDAMQYLLVGGRSGAKFNIAATDDAKRSLEGYIRGRIGAQDKEFLREGDVITHIALEFYDDEEETYSIIGAILDLPKTGTLKERFYILENESIQEEYFIDKKFPRNYISMRDYLKALNVELNPYDTQKAYRDALAKFFGIDARKYARILPKALAFQPIDLQQFMFEFLLDDDPIDIRSLRNNVEQLKKVELQIIKDREKLEKLDKITDAGELITNSKDQIVINEIISQLNWVEQRESYIKTSENKFNVIEQKLAKLRDDKSKLDIEIEENEATILNLERTRSNDDLDRTIIKYKEAFRKKEIEYENEKEIILSLKEMLKDEFTVLKDLMNLVPSEAFKSFVNYYQSSEDNLNPLELTNVLSLIINDVQSYLQAYHTEREKIENEKQKISNQVYHAKQRLNQLKRNIKSYSRQVEQLIQALNEGLTNHYQRDIKVQPLAELIEVNDPKWRNTLEGYLGNQRFNIIVEPEYFDLALQIYDSVKEELGIFGVGLVNTQKLQDFFEVNENSLAAKIDTDYRHARNYVNMLLNNVITVENANELKNHRRSVTASGMTYSNFTANRLNPRLSEIPYIGSSATELQIEIEEKELVELETNMEKLHNESNTYSRILRLLGGSKASQIIHQNHIRYIDEIKETRREYTHLQDQLTDLVNSPSIAKLEAQLNVERNRKRQLKMDSDRIVSEIGAIRNERQQLSDLIEETKAKLADYTMEQEELAKLHSDKLTSAHTQFYALKQRFNNSNSAIADSLVKDNTAVSSQIARTETELVNLMRMYVREYFFASEPNYEHLDEFIKEATIIRSNNLVQYEYQATELRRNSEIGFKEEFVNKLRASIETAQQKIDDLNIALEGKVFGNDSYRLIYQASVEPDFKLYYDMIMNASSLDENALFTEGLSKKNEQILMELFDKIASTNPEHDKLNLLFLDYRHYMSYDLEVTSTNGNKWYFSKVSRQKSGGETQVPFYIVIAASFQQLLSRNKRVSSGCIVLFDEAFSKMDESRINTMMKFYNSLSIQLIIAVPPQKVVDIIDYVNTGLMIIKENDFGMIGSFKDHRLLLDEIE